MGERSSLVIKDFMAQGGDPTNSGKGGMSSWGRPFKDEIHGRIKFNHRGQLAMANENKPNTNQSQFFITLGDCEWLNRKHTIFGKVTGNTIFNALRMSEVECDEDDRPLDNIVLKSVEVLWNPFDDIIPRNIKAAPAATKNTTDDKKRRRKGKKDMKLLSFGEDPEVDDAGTKHGEKMISAHDVGNTDGDGSVLLSSEVVAIPVCEKNTTTAKATATTKATATSEVSVEVKEKVTSTKLRTKDSDSHYDSLPPTSPPKPSIEIGTDNKSFQSDSATNYKTDNADEALAIKRDIIRSRRAVKVMTGEEAVKHHDDAALRDFVTPLQRQRQRFMKRKREHGDRENETLSKLMQFSSNIKAQKNKCEVDESKVNHSETYHGQLLEKDESADIGDDEDWHVGKLKFRKHIDDTYRHGNDV
eukprot:CAMPEP_0114455658 /NCGR_PEP_ID=MMETSP0104-20121206/3214_1 /TAXON_ID=37642 ORGANISM="Paraphysomonas imperforata, Strain PA2" /NCGR_SAMPLE_ID=MMETSP0104 /ASSEMBLY_ACC=CAM_ASM_000202 /LENGTH=415 /DNA_ID=CAMNT_0001628087 /DNA_START=143 /DNA_END=1390 /DNA_ORIENTATION=+